MRIAAIDNGIHRLRGNIVGQHGPPFQPPIETGTLPIACHRFLFDVESSHIETFKVMSRQKRNVPVGLGRFNYWTFSFAIPGERTDTIASPADRASHAYCTAVFHRMLSDPTVALENAAAIQALYRFIGPLSKDGAVLSLAWYAANDLAWRQDLVARKTLKSIDPTSHLTLVSYDKQHQRGVKPWSWQSLLPRIALDQTVFRQMLRKGAAAVNILGTIDTSSRTLWQRFSAASRVSSTEARRVTSEPGS